MARYECHDVCTLFPPMSAEESAELRADIEKHGVQTAVVLWKNPDKGNKLVIIEGRHRSAICEELGGEFLNYPTREFVGTPEEMVHHIISLNLHRRHLNSSQRAAVCLKAGRMLEVYRNAGGRAGRPSKEAADGAGLDSSSPQEVLPRGSARKEAAKIAGVGEGQIARAAIVAKASPEKLDEVIAGTKSLERAVKEVKAAQEEERAEEQADEPETAAPSHRERMEEFNRLMDDSAKEAMAVARNLPDGLNESQRNIIGDKAKALAASIRAYKGHDLCPKCDGEGCAKCDRNGWLDKVRFDSHKSRAA